jgi:hypothetical protein
MRGSASATPVSTACQEVRGNQVQRVYVLKLVRVLVVQLVRVLVVWWWIWTPPPPAAALLLTASHFEHRRALCTPRAATAAFELARTARCTCA